MSETVERVETALKVTHRVIPSWVDGSKSCCHCGNSLPCQEAADISALLAENAALSAQVARVVELLGQWIPPHHVPADTARRSK